MYKKLIAQLVENSYTNSKLDAQKVLSIAEKLSKRHLRIYIKLLKKHIAENTVNIETAFQVDEVTKAELEKIYTGKRIEYTQNKDLMLGIKVYENDIIYSKNLKDTLSGIKNYLVK